MKNIRQYIILLVAVLCFAGYTPLQGKDTTVELTVKLQATLDTLCEDQQFPGVTLGVVLPNGQRISLASGMADIEKNIKMPSHARIFSGSIGKTYAAAVAMQLMKEGKFSLDDKISRFFHAEKWFTRLPNHKDITVRMLMNHTGGLPRHVLKPGLWKTVFENPDKIWTGAELIAFIFDDEPVHPAGKGWAYSDTDYIILAMIMEKTTGETFYDMLEKRVLKPQKLTGTSPAVHRRLKGMVQGYTGKNKPPFNIPSDTVVVDGKLITNPQFEWTGGGLITTSTELAAFVKLLMEGEIVSPDSLKLMKSAVNERTGQPDTSGYGLGLEIWDTPQGITYGHRGTMLGCMSIMEYVPKHRFSIALQTNVDGFSSLFKAKSSRNHWLIPLKKVILNHLATTRRVDPLKK